LIHWFNYIIGEFIITWHHKSLFGVFSTFLASPTTLKNPDSSPFPPSIDRSINRFFFDTLCASSLFRWLEEAPFYINREAPPILQFIIYLGIHIVVGVSERNKWSCRHSTANCKQSACHFACNSGPWETSAFKVCCLVGGGIRSHFFLNRTVSKQTFFIPQDETKRRVKTTNNN